MVAPLTSEPVELDSDTEHAGSDLSVEPVERVPSVDATDAEVDAPDRLHRVRLELRAAALEAALGRARRQRDMVVEQYERILEGREGVQSVEFSWRD